MANMLSEASEPLNVLYYGDGGTGKTSHMAAMARLGRVLSVNAESGVKARALRKLGIPVQNIEVFPDPARGETVSLRGLEDLYRRIASALIRDPQAYAGVFWDSITEIYKKLLEAVVARGVIQAARAGRERDPFFIERGDYGIMTEQVRSLMRKYRDLPCHFAVSALARREQDNDGAVVYQPAVTPALQGDMIGWMDMVCHTSVAIVNDEEEYRGLFRPHGKYRGKDRLRAVPKWLIDPTFDRLLMYVDEELDVDSDPVMQAGRERQAKENAKLEQAAQAAATGNRATA